MIYILDDKKSRQVSYNWTEQRFSKYENFIKPIYAFSDLEENALGKRIFTEDNTVLFHESFFDADFNKNVKDSLKVRRDLEDFAERQESFKLAFFSGSKTGRALTQNIAYLPVSVLYQNLEEYVLRLSSGNNDLRYLVYGKNYAIEEAYLDRLFRANDAFGTNSSKEENTGHKVLIARSIRNQLPKVFNNVVYQLLGDDSDEILHRQTVEWLNKTRFDKIFIPLCFGKSLSDFNGLRLAVHIRCTQTNNQSTPIYIYGFIGLNEMLNDPYFNILKTKNVFLIDYTFEAFTKSINWIESLLESQTLPQEILKLQLDVPDNYDDNHSIANEWAIYKWSKAIDRGSAINKIINKVDSQIYFKYLSTIYPTKNQSNIDTKSLTIERKGQPKILYVDDDAEKGWYDLICYILSDINGIENVDYLGDDLKKVPQKEIMDKTLKKIKDEDIDLVILDFRLHPDDLTATDVKAVTGYMLLKQIKEINPGIQVIIFSATNKIWNLKALTNAGADGFVIKESPENSRDASFTLKAISEFVKIINHVLDRLFIKDLFETLKTIEKRLKSINRVPENSHFNEFVKSLKKQLEIIFECTNNVTPKRLISFDIVFLSCYTFLDLFKKYYLIEKKDHRFYLGYRCEDLQRYVVEGNQVESTGDFLRNNQHDKPGIFHIYSGLLKDYYNDLTGYNLNYYIISFNKIKHSRNEYIHGSKQTFNKEELRLIIKCLLPITHNVCE